MDEHGCTIFYGTNKYICNSKWYDHLNCFGFLNFKYLIFFKFFYLKSNLALLENVDLLYGTVRYGTVLISVRILSTGTDDFF